jgi:hypothetical protein
LGSRIYDPVWFRFYPIFDLKTQKPIQTVWVLSGVSTMHVCGPLHLHYGSDSPKCDSHAAFQKKAATNPSLHPSHSIACPPESMPPLILLPSRAIPALLSPCAVCSTANRTSPTSSVDDACEVLPLSLCPYLSAAFAPHEVSFFNRFL